MSKVGGMQGGYYAAYSIDFVGYHREGGGKKRQE